MTTYYLVSEIVDEDGGFGDAMPTKIPLAIFPTNQEAIDYVQQNSHPQEYANPYQPLSFGELVIDTVVNQPHQPANQLPHYDDRSDWSNWPD